MSRLLWVAVGAAAAVAGARRLGLVTVGDPSGAGTGARAVLGTVRAAAAAGRDLGAFRHELRAGMAEREQQLRHDLVGDVDVDALRAERAARRAAADDAGPARPAPGDGRGEPGSVEPPAWHRDPAERAAARAARARKGWADEPTEDPDDAEGELPYTFY